MCECVSVRVCLYVCLCYLSVCECVRVCVCILACECEDVYVSVSVRACVGV